MCFNRSLLRGMIDYLIEDLFQTLGMKLEKYRVVCKGRRSNISFLQHVVFIQKSE